MDCESITGRLHGSLTLEFGMQYAVCMAETVVRVRRAQSAALQAYHALKQAICQGTFRSGQRLIEAELAKMLGISRTPVREALSKLEAQGLVDTLSTGGVVVRDLSAELLEILGLRRSIEAFAANLAARRATTEELLTIQQAYEEALALVDDPSLEKRAERDRRFHRLVTLASHSPRLARLFDDYAEYLMEKEMLQFFNRGSALRAHGQHQAIVDALRRHDSEGAERLMKEHFMTVEHAIAAVAQPAGAQQDTGGHPRRSLAPGG